MPSNHPRRSTIRHLLERKEFQELVKGRLVGKDVLPPTLFQNDTKVRESEIDRLTNETLVLDARLQTLEAIIREIGRPVYFVEDSKLKCPIDELWRADLDDAKEEINKRVKAVGRIELLNGGQHLGTGWLIDQDVLITNRHVAEIFLTRSGERTMIGYRQGRERFEPRVDFLAEFKSDEEFPVDITDCLFLSRSTLGQPDVAVLHVKPNSSMPEPLTLAEARLKRPTREAPLKILVIGYPAADPGRNDPFEMDRLFQGVYGVKRIAPGELMAISENQAIFEHDCTTLGGNSGSPVLDLKSGEVIGLHFSGSYHERNLAVSAQQVRACLQEAGWYGKSVLVPYLPAPQTLSTTNVPSRNTQFPAPPDKPEEAFGILADVNKLCDRSGYDGTFLDKTYKVPLPIVNPDLDIELAAVADRNDALLNYTHFTIAVHSNRRFAFFAACNIDKSLALNSWAGESHSWFLDPRVDIAYQAGEELYVRNRLERRPLIRPLDVGWGQDVEEKQRAIADTFFFTNCIPQHRRSNEVTWRELENYVLSRSAKVLRLCVLTGPVLRKTDKTYRRVQVPEEFWKVIVVINAASDKPSATGYLLSQAELLEDVEFAYGPYRTYQVPISAIESRAGILFDQMYIKNFDPLGSVETTPMVLIETPEDLAI